MTKWLARAMLVAIPGLPALGVLYAIGRGNWEMLHGP